MRVREDFKQSVAFFGARKDDGTFHANGTGFFVSVEPDYVYLVTASHVAKNFPGNEFVMRSNPQPYTRAMTGQQHMDMEMKNIRWYIHPNDATVDIAVAPLAHLSPRLLAQKTIPASMFSLHESNYPVTYTPEEARKAYLDATIQSRDHTQPEKLPTLSVGDETSTIGLYSLVPGQDDNVPVVRIGNIAMMPGEAILCADGLKRELYLIEMRSIAGLSGSPVFALSPITNIYFLIGIIHGHHTIEESQTTLHTGMALVTPIKKLLDILNQLELVELRKEEEALRQQWDNASKDKEIL